MSFFFIRSEVSNCCLSYRKISCKDSRKKTAEKQTTGTPTPTDSVPEINVDSLDIEIEAAPPQAALEEGGDDTVTVSVDNTELIEVPITFDGGPGSDTLVVEGFATPPVATAEYQPGASVTEGRLTYDDTMIIDLKQRTQWRTPLYPGALLDDGSLLAIQPIAGTAGDVGSAVYRVRFE